MRLCEDRIKQGILHPLEAVRCAAVGYFTDAHSRDPSLMPLVLQSVETFGRDHAFSLLRDAEGLAQTPETIGWICDELRWELDLFDVAHDNYRFALALILCRADVELLKRDAEKIVELPLFPEQLTQIFWDRIDLRSGGWTTPWAALQAFCRQGMEGMIRSFSYANLICEAMGSFPEAPNVDAVLQFLQGTSRQSDYRHAWHMEPFVIRAAGRLRLEAAIPCLTSKLFEEDEVLADAAIDTLEHIGSDAVVRALQDVYWRAQPGDRIGVIEPLKAVHTELAVETLLGWLARERHPDQAVYAGSVLASQFDDRAIEPVRQLILREEHNSDKFVVRDVNELKEQLVVACLLLEQTVPEFDAWRNQSEELYWKRKSVDTSRIADDFDETDHEEELGLINWDDENWDEDQSDDADDFLRAVEMFDPIHPDTYVNLAPKVGRNEQCPCGSGRKYKRCCGSRANEGPSLN